MTVLTKTFIEQLADMKKEYDENDALRENAIKSSRDILKPAKKAIYAVHKDDISFAEELLKEARQAIKISWDLVQKSHFESVGSLKAGIEEYVEAACFIEFVKHKQIPLKKELEKEFTISEDVYLSALCDFAGELVRRAVLKATKKDLEEVKNIYKTIEELYGLYLNFDFRNGELRKKFDSLKYNLSKTESIMYDLSLRS
jgi:predicted translin family RNA/ssDNA-binding protein